MITNRFCKLKNSGKGKQFFNLWTVFLLTLIAEAGRHYNSNNTFEGHCKY
jgi:hypothetical protein